MAKIEDTYVLTSRADTGGIEKAKGSVISLGGAIKSIGTGLSAFGTAVKGLQDIGRIGGQVFAELSKASPRFAQSLETVKKQFEAIAGPVIQKVADALLPVLQRLMVILGDPEVQAFIDKIGTFLVEAINQVVLFIDNILIPVLNGDWQTAWNNALDFVRGIDWNGVMQFIIGAIQGAWNALGAILAAPFNAAVQSIVMMLLIIERALTDSINGVIGGVNQMIRDINAALGTSIGQVQMIKTRAVSLGTNGGFAWGEGGSGEVTPKIQSSGGVTINSINIGSVGRGMTPLAAGGAIGSGVLNVLRRTG